MFSAVATTSNRSFEVLRSGICLNEKKLFVPIVRRVRTHVVDTVVEALKGRADIDIRISILPKWLRFCKFHCF